MTIVGIRVDITIRCDEPGCKIPAETFRANKQRECFKVARSNGWYVKGERCLCPQHKAERAARLEREQRQATATSLPREF